jgi:hypothetical protein
MLEMETYPGWPGGGSASVYAITYPPIFTKVGYSNHTFFFGPKPPILSFLAQVNVKGNYVKCDLMLIF